MSTATSPILLKWDPKSLEIRTLTVERLLEPLVTQVILSTLFFHLLHLNVVPLLFKYCCSPPLSQQKQHQYRAGGSEAVNKKYRIFWTISRNFFPRF